MSPTGILKSASKQPKLKKYTQQRLLRANGPIAVLLQLETNIKPNFAWSRTKVSPMNLKDVKDIVALLAIVALQVICTCCFTDNIDL